MFTSLSTMTFEHQDSLDSWALVCRWKLDVDLAKVPPLFGWAECDHDFCDGATVHGDLHQGGFSFVECEL
jgi:hypothetical protein